MLLSPALAAESGSARAQRFELCVRPHLAASHQLARRILKCPDRAADAVQEALLALWSLGEEPPVLRAWLLRAVRHRALHLRRSARRANEREQRAARREHDLRGPLHCALCREHAEAIEAALRELPDELRELLQLRAEGELDYVALAARAGLPIGTVRSRLSRVRAALRAQLVGSAD
ncbi:MAG: sigma-70 family RNA polymerase sigma factor [Planctomycetes bacterium]|nr:sigma-70 family RNA polymerase sigma factor [Planctomycetota bacterium]